MGKGIVQLNKDAKELWDIFPKIPYKVYIICTMIGFISLISAFFDCGYWGLIVTVPNSILWIWKMIRRHNYKRKEEQRLILERLSENKESKIKTDESKILF